ncbi:neuraminidase-like domain-containing protein [Pseudomonas sp. GL-B-19]|uniref:Tc toxin subunit A-related protein n=1 Tax=Pseudomonas sp. GL-B-19 TaxID=2832393 RepID=UPI001CBB9BD3|nr:neuraminidase-like domain-containing protein [Pseudomonas sp. GL-B-19]
MTNSTAINAIQTARRDALVDYYTTYCIPQTALGDGTPLSLRVKNAEDLYEYLLLDTRIGPEVLTSRVAETISSLQLYINRCLRGTDPDVNNASESTMVEQSKPGRFLYDWPDYNQVYSTWAGKERLQYYPSTYISPGLRYSKTELFKSLEETINQGRISDSRVQAGFQQYLFSFETLANLKTISGYQAGTNASADSQDTLYFIGRSQNAPHNYYWRSCNMAVRSDENSLTGGAWSQWLKINVPTEEALDNMIRPCWFNQRLYICWISRTAKNGIGSSNVTIEYEYFSNIWYLQGDGVWVSYKKESLPRKPSKFSLVNNMLAGKLRFLDESYALGEKDFVYSDAALFEDKAKEGDVHEFHKLNTTVTVGFVSDSTIELRYKHAAIAIVRQFDHDGDFIGEMRFNVGNNTEYVYELSNNTRYLEVELSIGGVSESQKVHVYMGYDLPLFGRLFHLAGGLLKCVLETSGELVVSNLETSSAPYFTSMLQSDGVGGLLSYNCQAQDVEGGNTAPIDFNSSYGLYFWELFFHSSFLIADRYLTEQNYARAEQWHKYIFSPTGYRNSLGILDTVENDIRYWNVVPLQKDQTWNASIPETVDPDVIAMNDPMHYKMAVFLSSVNALIEHGDNCYRMQQRDYMTQAKMYYIQASQMLGPRPDIDYTNSWSNPTVGVEASTGSLQQSDSSNEQTPSRMATLFKAYLLDANGSFLPPYNADLLLYWDKLEVRLFNLRNNLTLDGQPLVLPLFATPVSPTALQLQHGAGNGAAGGSVPANQQVSEFRFPVLMDKARTAVSSVIQFGNELQTALLQRDNEYMTLLVQTQQQQISTLTQELQVDNIASLTSGVAASTEALNSAKTRLAHYTGLYNNWISSSEQSAMDLRVAAGALNAGSLISNVVGAAVEMAPNTFGLAVGGSRWGGAARAVAFGLQASATILETSAQRLDISEQYRRRRADWQIQKQGAEFEVKQLTAQIQSQNQQLAMAQKQKALYAQELNNMRAQYALQTTRFTGLELFNWMAGRLSSLYYQLYDSALALCLTTKAALGREIGDSNAGSLFTAPMWNDLYQGLLAGESLQLELQKMENIYLRLDKRGLEIQKTISLNTQITRADSSKSFSVFLNGALSGNPVVAAGGVAIKTVNGDKLVIELDIAALDLDVAYDSTGKVGRFKNIGVTLPALIGPYQDVEATLGKGSGNYVALSRGLDDSGLFTVDFNDPKYLPFEGDSTTTGTLVLTFFKAGTGQQQRELVESLVDVIFHLRYTLKGY